MKKRKLKIRKQKLELRARKEQSKKKLMKV